MARVSPFQAPYPYLLSASKSEPTRRARICEGIAAMDEAEWKPRRDRIDRRLRVRIPPRQLIPWKEGLDTSLLKSQAVTEFPTGNGPADYAVFVPGSLLDTLEARRVTISPQNVLEPAKRYATGATGGPNNSKGLRVPFLYASKGQIMWHLHAPAFRSQLVPQDSSDEPAERLSERIESARQE